jgi:iron complex outermembrane receptor protein
MRSYFLKAAASTLILVPSTALAQRTDDNAVTEADDAFGKTVGDEQVGIYNPGLARGFSPVAAGNLRIEGLYFDQQNNPNDRILAGSSIHVGISAQGYPFPAPTGIADYLLRKPGAEFVTSIAASYGPLDSKSVEIDLQVPLDGSRLGVLGGAAIYRDQQLYGAHVQYESYAASLVYRPSDNFSVQPFWGRVDFSEEEAQPLYFTAGAFLPPRIPRGKFLGQKWSDARGTLDNLGVVTKAKALGFDLGLGVFRSVRQNDRAFSDLLFGVQPDGSVGQRILIGDKDDFFASWSGEFKASRAFVEGPRQHRIHASLRARSVERRYGGSSVIDLGASVTDEEDFRPEPVETFGPKTRDKVEQKTFGLGYELRWRDIGEMSFGVQKTDYRKNVDDPFVVFPETRDKPWLYSATAAINLSESLAVYGGYTRGLEESDVAPANAINRNDAPPAIRTEQKDFGLRWKISPGVSAVVGYFDVEKPYFNLDAGNVFRQLGSVRNRGIEMSLSGQLMPGLFVVAGTVILDAKVSGEEVDNGLIGRRPVGTFKRHNIVNANWTVPWHKPLALTARWEATSNRTANAANTLSVPARSVLGLGARYKLDLGKTPLLIRANIDNVFNTFGWAVGGSGFFVPNGQRRLSVSIAADF